MKATLLLLLLLAAPPLWAGNAPNVPDSANERWEIVSHTFIGLETRSMTDEERAPYGAALNPRLGLLVTRVVPHSPAEQAGMKAGDILLHMCGCKLYNPASLLVSMRNNDPGIPMHFSLLRNGVSMRMRVIPAARPEPVIVGYYTPHKLHTDKLEKIRPKQANIARILAGDAPTFKAVRDEMEAIAYLLCDSYSPGALQLHYHSEDCDISVARYWKRVVVTMKEGDAESQVELVEGEEKPLPDRVRQRLAEMGRE